MNKQIKQVQDDQGHSKEHSGTAETIWQTLLQYSHLAGEKLGYAGATSGRGSRHVDILLSTYIHFKMICMGKSTDELGWEWFHKMFINDHK